MDIRLTSELHDRGTIGIEKEQGEQFRFIQQESQQSCFALQSQ